MNDFLWHVKSKIYHSIRNSFPFNLILNRENKRLESLLALIYLKGKIVLDLGTGTGNALQFLDEAKVVFAIDSNFSMLQATRRMHPDAILIQADALSLPIKAKSIQVITAIGLCEYMSEIESLLKGICQSLKENGFLILTFSPKGIFTRLRLLLGHAIKPATLSDIEKIARKEHFQKVKSSRCLMQAQVLFIRIK